MSESKKYVKVDEDVHTELKVRSAKEGRTLTEYLTDLVRKALGLKKSKDGDKE